MTGEGKQSVAGKPINGWKEIMSLNGTYGPLEYLEWEELEPFCFAFPWAPERSSEEAGTLLSAREGEMLRWLSVSPSMMLP